LNSELIISSTANEVKIALLEEKKLVELNSEKKNQNFAVGDIYLGRIKKLIPGLNAAFVDVGHEKDAFLHYLDLGPQLQSLLKLLRATTGKNPVPDPMMTDFALEPDINKGGKITQALTTNQWVLVQVAKEPISSKGPRITSEISLAGRFVVLVPFYNHISVSQKIKSAEERMRLKRLAHSIRPKNFSIIVRTVAEGKKVAELDKDVQELVAKWKGAWEQLKTARPPQKIIGELSRTSTILRDLLNANFNSIHVNDPQMYDEIRSYITSISPEQADIVKLYKGKVPIFDFLGIDKQIKGSFGKTVTMNSGAYLVIEHTEAMHVIDVNSGGRVRHIEATSQENNALHTNLDAAEEIARQLRLRDMGGIIVVDFIDMTNAANRKVLYDKLRGEMAKDRARHTILPPSKFGLIQITRERFRPETNITTVEKCPTCGGTGEIKASILLVDEIENNLRYFAEEQNEKDLTIHIHPYLEAFLNKGTFFKKSIVGQWMKKYKAKIKVLPENNYHIMEYHFFNKNEEEIKI